VIRALRYARIAGDRIRVELGVLLWRFGDWLIVPTLRPLTRVERWRRDAGNVSAELGELLIGQRLMDAAYRLRFPDALTWVPDDDELDGDHEFERRTW